MPTARDPGLAAIRDDQWPLTTAETARALRAQLADRDTVIRDERAARAALEAELGLARERIALARRLVAAALAALARPE